jgi:hypothetical protein
MAGASKNIYGGTWWADRMANVDARDGSGALDALESVRIAKNFGARDAPGTRRGWHIGTLRNADVRPSGLVKFSYRVKTPATLLSAKVKVVLAWDGAGGIGPGGVHVGASNRPDVDLDLMVVDEAGALVAYAGTRDNSYEIAEFSARRGETYTISIWRWWGTIGVRYGIAWTVFGKAPWEDSASDVDVGGVLSRRRRAQRRVR